MNKKIHLEFKIGLILIDQNQFFSMKPSNMKYIFSFKTYDKKTVEKCRNGYVAENRIVFKLYKL